MSLLCRAVCHHIGLEPIFSMRPESLAGLIVEQHRYFMNAVYEFQHIMQRISELFLARIFFLKEVVELAEYS